MAQVAAFTVYGEALSQGSMKTVPRRWTDPAGVVHHTSRITHSNPELVIWRADIQAALQAHVAGVFFPKDTAVKVLATFYLARPLSLPKKILLPVRQRDLDKLARAALDAMTGKLYADDKQVTHLGVRKRFAVRPCAKFLVTEDEAPVEALPGTLPFAA